jgi:ribosomal protein L32
MAKKRRRKPGLQRCSICGSYQLTQELEGRICLACLGLVGVKRWRPKGARDREELAAPVTAAAGPTRPS